MQSLLNDYKERLQAVAELIQGSDELAAYLEEETPELYKNLQEAYEPLIAEIYQEVADNHPLQLPELETVLLNPFFEGLFQPRILGYSVLRGELNDQIKYARPQESFKVILIAIANSTNFDAIRQRIGQTVQLGFALSSDIWIANLLDKIENKKVKSFLQSMIHDRFRDLDERRNLLIRYKKQFAHYNFLYTKFPESVSELKIEAVSLKSFLLNRIAFNNKHDSYIDEIHKLIGQKQFYREPEFIDIIAIISNFIILNQTETQHLSNALNSCRYENPQFNSLYFQFLKLNYKNAVYFGPEPDKKVYALLNKNEGDDLVRYYSLLETIHNKGFVHEDALDAVNAFYSQYEGMSVNNECLRLVILQLLHKVVDNLTEPEYHSFFEMQKTFSDYINIFGNSAFNLETESMSMNYVKKLLAFYKDKRSKEYQEVKKAVSSSFTDLGFLTEKELVDLFKIKRKKKEGPPA
ncbi:MAG: hypothetical protein IPG12_11625 [Saprospiraceae bacterium]|nr:hypothetical protein [Saprospiraceae bacterium]